MHKTLLSNIIFLPIILIIGLFTTYEDLKSSKIKNKWVLLGLIYSFFVYSAAWLLYIFGSVRPYLLWSFDKWCVNLAIVILVAYLLSHYKLWGAGDAKLFICYSSLIPLSQYSRVFFGYFFASFLLLLLIFIPATCYLFLRSCAYFIRRFKWDNVQRFAKERFNISNLLTGAKILFGFIVFFLFFYILRREVVKFTDKFSFNRNTQIIIALLVFKPLAKIFKNNLKTILLIFTFLFLYTIYTKGQFIAGIVNTLVSASVVVITFPILRKVIELYSERVAEDTTPFAFWIFLGALLTWFW